MADAADLKSAAVQAACGFEPHPRHQNGFVDGFRRFPLDQPRDPIGHASDTSPGGRRCGLTNAPLLGMLQSGRWLCPRVDPPSTLVLVVALRILDSRHGGAV